MRLSPVVLLSLLCCVITGCATPQARRCSALQDELAESGAACKACLERLTEGGDSALCQYVCAHPGAVAPAAVAACSPPAPELPPAAPSSPGQATVTE